jgi:5-methylcytosine-specific restriction protein A
MATTKGGTLWWTKGKSEELARFRRRVYNSKLWKDAREAALMKNPFCSECEKIGALNPATEVDHVVPLSELMNREDASELMFGEENLNPLCKYHHSQKSYTEGLMKKVQKNIKK